MIFDFWNSAFELCRIGRNPLPISHLPSVWQIFWDSDRSRYTTQCVEITIIYSHTFFRKNFVKATFLLKKLCTKYLILRNNSSVRVFSFIHTVQLCTWKNSMKFFSVKWTVWFIFLVQCFKSSRVNFSSNHRCFHEIFVKKAWGKSSARNFHTKTMWFFSVKLTKFYYLMKNFAEQFHESFSSQSIYHSVEITKIYYHAF